MHWICSANITILWIQHGDTFTAIFCGHTYSIFFPIHSKLFWWEFKGNSKNRSKEISVIRIEANGNKISWKANSHWARVKLYPEGQIVENYLTLVGGNREIELGSFLSPEERTLVRVKIENILRKIKSPV